MAGNLGELTVRLGLDSSGLSGGLRTAASSLAGFASSAPGLLNPVALVGVAVGAIAIGVGIATTKMAGDFQQAGTLLVTSAGESAKNIDMVKQGILQMAVDTGTSTDQLMKGMFNIESAGFRGKDALLVESAAARGARVENSDLAATTDVLTTTMHNYHETASQAVDTMNSFRMAASMGKMHMDDLTGALKNVLPISSQAGVHLTDVEAAISTMSNSGDKGAAAGTHLSQMLTYLLAPSSKATKALQSVGLTTQEISDEMKVSLPGAVEMITQAVGEKFPVGSAKYIAAISAIVGGNKSMKAMLELSGGSFKEFTGDVAALAPTMKSASTSIDGFAAVQGNLNFKVDRAKEAIEVLGIKVGTHLLPVVSQLVDKGADLISNFTAWEEKTHGVENAIGFLGDAFNKVSGFVQGLVTAGSNLVSFFQRNQLAALALLIPLGMLGAYLATTAFMAIAFASVAIPGIIAGFIGWAAAAWTAAIGTLAVIWPILLIGVIIGVVVAIIILAVTHWGQITHWLSGVWGAFSSWFMALMGQIGTWFTSVWHSIASFFTNLWTGTIANVVGAWNGLKNWASNLFTSIGAAIRTAVIAVVVWLGATWQNAVNTVVGWFNWLYNHNYYFKDLVDTIRNVVSAVVSWLEMIWNNDVHLIVSLWQWLSSTAQSVWHSITSFIMGIVTPVVAWIQNAWSTAVNWITVRWQFLSLMAQFVWAMIVSVIQSKMTQAWNFLVGIWNSIVGTTTSASTTVWNKITAMWTTISGIFSSAWSRYISGPLGSLWNNISSTINGWATSAYNSGANFVKMIANGITSGIGWVSNAVQNIAGAIWKNLGFHSPTEEGPASDSDVWMPNLIKMLVSGLNAGVPQMQSATYNVVKPLQDNLQYPIKPSASAVAASVNGSSSNTGAQGQQTFIFEVDGHQLSQITNKHTDSTVRLKLGNRSIRAA